MVELLHLVVALEGGLGGLDEVVAAAGDKDNSDLLPLVIWLIHFWLLTLNLCISLHEQHCLLIR